MMIEELGQDAPDVYTKKTSVSEATCTQTCH